MSDYTVYTKPDCMYCVRAKVALKGRGLSFEELDGVALFREMQARVMAATGKRAETYPQIFYGEEYVGGFDQLSEKLNAQGN